MQSVLERDFSKPFVVTDHVRKNRVPKPFRWTVREYYQMAELGFFNGKRVELIRGEIVEMSPMKSPHATSIQLTADVLSELFRKGFAVWSQLPMSFSNADEPEPDVAVVRHHPRLRRYSPQIGGPYCRSFEFDASV